MSYVIEKRRCRRFEIPGAEVKFKKKGLLFWVQAFSEPCPVIDISKGSISFTCDKKLSNGKRLVIQLLIPNETPLNLNAIVFRQEQIMGSEKKITGIKFMPFGSRYGWNSRESLGVLRKLDEIYAGAK
jgi:hypothetical protein